MEWVFGKTEQPNLGAIDREAGLRSLGELLLLPDAYFYLLGRGFEFIEFTTFDPERFQREGYAVNVTWETGGRQLIQHAALLVQDQGAGDLV